jgi:hypothetical protein
MVYRHILNQETVLQAALTKDKRLTFNALLMEPLKTLGRKEAVLKYFEIQRGFYQVRQCENHKKRQSFSNLILCLLLFDICKDKLDWIANHL